MQKVPSKHSISKTKAGIDGFISSMIFDPWLHIYHPQLLRGINRKSFMILPNQFLYFYDFYERQMIHYNANIKKILGYDQEDDFSFLYNLIHPADRVMVYFFTLKSLQFGDSKYKAKPFQDTFTIDFRIKHKNGSYLRILRQTGSAAIDKQNNMVISYSLNTDITNIKSTSGIGADYTGNTLGYISPNKELLAIKSIFSKREKQILYHLCNGKTSAQISEILYISKHTVDTHRRNMLKKAMLRNTPELIIYALENELI